MVDTITRVGLEVAYDELTSEVKYLQKLILAGQETMGSLEKSIDALNETQQELVDKLFDLAGEVRGLETVRGEF